MEETEPQTPEMALAVYAATAATVAIKALQAARVLRDDQIGELVNNLMACRAVANRSPRIEEHIEMLTDILLSDPHRNG
jgi:hypothetical protein